MPSADILLGQWEKPDLVAKVKAECAALHVRVQAEE